MTGRNPLAVLLAAFLFPLPLLATLDPVTPAVALVLELVVCAALRIGPAAVLRRAWPLLLGAASVAVTVLPFAAPAGAVVLRVGGAELTSGVLVDAAALGLRVVAVALPGVLVLAHVDPTALADALIQHGRLPARFTLGALAALRLLPALRGEWSQLTLARRARGLASGRNPLRRAQAFVSVAFALLVGAVRAGTRLATAMDARGFDSDQTRTSARPRAFTRADVAVVLAAAALGAGLLAAALLGGWWRRPFG